MKEAASKSAQVHERHDLTKWQLKCSLQPAFRLADSLVLLRHSVSISAAVEPRLGKQTLRQPSRQPLSLRKFAMVIKVAHSQLPSYTGSCAAP
jgi:hypothetical protein